MGKEILVVILAIPIFWRWRFCLRPRTEEEQANDCRKLAKVLGVVFFLLR